MSVKVKICGITNLPDGLAAAEAGADALGFVFCQQSPRCVSIEAAAGLIRALPPSGLRGAVLEVEAQDGAKTVLTLSWPEEYALPPADSEDEAVLPPGDAGDRA